MRTTAITIVKALLFCIVSVGLMALFSSAKFFFPAKYERYWYGIIGTCAALIATTIFVRIEKKKFADIGLYADKKTLLRFFVGFLIGVTVTSIMVGIILIFGGVKLKLNPNYSLSSFFIWVFALVPLAFMEELTFRAYSLRRLTEATGIWPAQIIIAFLFALYHTVGGGPSLLSTLTGPGFWAFIFGAAALRSGGIALPTGLHFAANFVLVAIGEKRDFPSVWTIQFEKTTTPALQAQAEQAGMIAQVFILIVGLYATFRIAKSKRNVSGIDGSVPHTS